MEIDKLYSQEVEQTILGAMISSTESCLVILEGGVREDDFYHTSNQILHKTIKDIFKEKNISDLLLLLEKLKDEDLITKAGGITYITEIATSMITTSNLTNYIERLKVYSQKRKLIEVSKYINANIGKNIEEIQQEVTSLVNNVIDDKASNETAESQEESYLEVLEKRMKGEEGPIKTGLRDIDNKINGFNSGDLVSIFAFSGVGKTALAAQIALNIIEAKKRVLIFSLEMGKEQIRDRIISNITGIPFSKVRYGNLESHELDEVVQANMFLSSNKGLLVSEEDELLNITSKVQMEVMRNGVDIVFIDYINLINIMGNNKEEFYRVTECTRLLKKLAKKVNIPIVILAQGKQEAASKMNNKSLEIWDKVAVNDIAGGASIYRDSDIVLGMYRNVELDNKLVRDKLHQEDERNINYNSPSADKNPQCMTLLIKKSRASGKDIIAARWKAENYRISDW